jgi:plastocyanin
MVRAFKGWVVAMSVVAGVFSPAPARAGEDEVVIELFRTSFFPRTVEVSVGDTVTWVLQDGTHQIASGTGPDDPEAGALFDVGVDTDTERFSFVIGTTFPDGISFFCREHPTRVGFITVDEGEISHRVGVVDNEFIPDIVWIFEGDTVRWEHEPMEMFHTVTSGTGRDDPRAADLFDAPSSDEFPVFEYRFDQPGTEPYYCIPHEDLGMVGTVHVQKRFLRGDTNDDGGVDISDASATLSFLFTGGEKGNCDDALDANDDGQIDIGDPVFTLNYLFLGSTAIRDPFPLAGQDRTEDELRCMP